MLLLRVLKILPLPLSSTLEVYIKTLKILRDICIELVDKACDEYCSV